MFYSSRSLDKVRENKVSYNKHLGKVQVTGRVLDSEQSNSVDNYLVV